MKKRFFFSLLVKKRLFFSLIVIVNY